MRDRIIYLFKIKNKLGLNKTKLNKTKTKLNKTNLSS